MFETLYTAVLGRQAQISALFYSLLFCYFSTKTRHVRFICELSFHMKGKDVKIGGPVINLQAYIHHSLSLVKRMRCPCSFQAQLSFYTEVAAIFLYILFWRTLDLDPPVLPPGSVFTLFCTFSTK